MLTIDANVFVSAASSTELQHKDSTAFFTRLLQNSELIYCPALVIPETAAGIARPTCDALRARHTASGISQLPGLTLVALDENLAGKAASIAILHRLRGADAVYAAVAQEFGTTLITWDAEMLARCPAAVATLTPTDWLAANPIV